MSGVRSGVERTPAFFVNAARCEGGPDDQVLVEAVRRAVRR